MSNQAGNGNVSRRSFIKAASSLAGVAVVGIPNLKQALAQPIPPSVSLPKETLLQMYHRMQRIRQGELKARALAQEREHLGSSGHQSAGEEACCVGVAFAMEDGDLLTGTHRSHGYPLALGVEPNAWMAELMMKVDGTNRGHGGTMHIAAPEMGCLAMSGIVGSGVPHAVGAARSFKLLGKPNVAVATCGDAAMNTSGFNSSLNLAAIWDLPVVFVVHNNQYGIDSPITIHSSLAKAGKDQSQRALGYGIPGITVDGNDLLAVYKAAKYCLDKARQGEGPSLLELVTYRHWAHTGPGEHEVVTVWNRPGELAYWLRRDPIPRFERQVLDGELLTAADLETVRSQVAAEIEAAVQFGINSPYPDPEEELAYFEDVFNIKFDKN